MMFPLYIDPGTGSMLFSLFIGLAAAGTFAARSAFLKLRFILSGGRAGKQADEKNIPFVIFSDHKRYWNVFHALCDEFESNGVELAYYTCSPDDPALSVPYKHVHAEYLGRGNRPYARMNLLHADIVVATTPGLDVYQWKRSRYVKWYVHIPHTVRSLQVYRMFGLDHYDAVLTGGRSQDESGREMEEARPAIARKEYVAVGSPVMDNILAQRKSAGVRPANARPVVLVAPSWGKSGILTKFGAGFLKEAERTGYEVVVRPHPQTAVSERHILEPLMERFPDIEWNFDNDNFAVLDRADVLISDFSGTMFDFALGFGKPVIYTDVEFDRAPYDYAWSPREPWDFAVLPRIGIRLGEEDFGRMGEVIAAALSNGELRANLDAVRGECWENPGGSARAEFDYLREKWDVLSKD